MTSPMNAKRRKVLGCLAVCVLVPVVGWVLYQAPLVREMVVGLAGRMGTPAIPVLRRATFDGDNDVRRAAGNALAALGAAAVPPLVESLGDEDPAVRAQAARALGYLREQGRAAVPALLEALSDPEAEVRRAAIRAITSVGATQDGVLPATIAALKDEDASVRARAAENLGHYSGEFAVRAKLALPDIRQLTQDPDPGVRAAAEESLERMTDER